MGHIEATTKITAKLPDGKPLELPDGATGADAAAAIGPGLAKAALAIRVDGELRDLAAPLPDGRRDRDPHRPRPRGAGADPPRRRPRHGRGGDGALPGHEGDDRPADRAGLLLRLRVPARRQGHRGGPRPDRGGDARARQGRRALRAPRRAARRGDRDLPRPGPGLQGRADRGPRPRRRRRDRLALPQRPLRGPLPRPARPLHRPHRRDQAQLARRRLLARRREPRDADPDLRHRLLLEEGPRPAPRADRGGEGARPPPPRPPARPLHAAQGGAGDALLARPRHDPAAPDRGRGARAAAPPRVRRDQDAAPDGRRAVAPLRPLGQLPGEHVLHRVEGAPVRDPADELPRRLPRLRLRAPLLPRAAAAHGRVRPGLPRRARGRPARPAAGARLHPGRRPHLLHAGADRRRGDRHLRGDRRALRPLRLRGRPHRALDPAGEVDRHRGAVGAGRRRVARRARERRAASTRSTPATAPSTARRSTSTSPTRSAAPGSAAPARSTSSCRSASTSPTPTRTTTRSGR